MAVSRPRTYAAAKFRQNIVLVATVDPRVWNTPETFHHQIGRATIDLFHNGRRLDQAEIDRPSSGEYYVFETVVGVGFDAVRLTRWTPNARSTFRANYIAT